MSDTKKSPVDRRLSTSGEGMRAVVSRSGLSTKLPILLVYLLTVMLLFPTVTGVQQYGDPTNFQANTSSAMDPGKPTLVVGGDNTWQPYEFVEHGQPAGFDFELMQAVGETMGYTVVVRTGPWNDMRKDLYQGRIDVLVGMFYSGEREENEVDFSVPYAEVSYDIFVRSDSPIRSLNDTRNKAIIAIKDDIIIEYIKKEGLTSQVIPVNNIPEGINLLASGKYDAAFLPKMQGLYFSTKYGLTNLQTLGVNIEPQKLCFAVEHGNRDLAFKLNEGLNILKTNGKYDALYEKWFGIYERRNPLNSLKSLKDASAVTSQQLNTDVSPVQLSAEERRWIETHPDITFCPDPDFPPFEFYDESGAYAGLSADYLRLIEKKTGLHLVLVKENDWNICIEKIKAKKVDLLSTVFTSDLRKGYLNYSDSFYQPAVVIITKKSVEPTLTMDDLNGMSVTVVDGYTMHELLRQKYPGIRLQPVPNIRTGLQRVSLGKADAFFNDLATSTYYVEKEGITNLHIAGEYKPTDPQQFRVAFGIRNNEPELQAILNKGLLMITPVERDQITKKWISSSLTPSPFDFKIVLAFLASVGVLIMIIGITLVWNRSLRRAVDEKTKELSRELEERKKAQESLRESEKKYRTILENIQDVFYRSDRDGNLVMASPSWASMLGYDSLDECLGHSIAEKFYKDPYLRKDFIDAVYSSGSVSDYEVVLKKKDGTPLFVSTNSHLYPDKSGAVGGVEGIFRDITERKRAEENILHKTEELNAAYEQLTATEEELRHNFDELQRSQQALTQARKKLNLLNTITFQDIQNALFSLTGYLELQRELPMDEKAAAYLKREREVAEKISNTLVFARNYQDMGIKPPLWQNTNQVFLLAISHLDISGLSRKVRLENLELYADPLLETVFFNLVENVTRHGKTATEISLYYRETTDSLTVFIEDNGAGIPDADKERIFERGYGKYKGMGLFLVREILGITDISIKETGTYGKGARFEIAVPKGAYRFADVVTPR